MVFQLTCIKNGPLLNFSNQHNMVDGVGAYGIFKLLSRVMQGEAIP
jgi:trichothecene 3-O-acetyltransferase